MIQSDILEGFWSSTEGGKRREGRLLGVSVLTKIFIESGHSLQGIRESDRGLKSMMPLGCSVSAV